MRTVNTVDPQAAQALPQSAEEKRAAKLAMLKAQFESGTLPLNSNDIAAKMIDAHLKLAATAAHSGVKG